MLVVHARRRVFDSHFKIDELTLSHGLLDGGRSPRIKRLVFDRGDSACVLLHDPMRGVLMLTRQLRPATLATGDGWILEAMAGSIEPGETAEAAIRREMMEEIGVAVRALQPIATVYASPGGSSERLHIFYARYGRRSIKLFSAHGKPGEHEDVQRVERPVSELLQEMEAGAVEDAKLLIALQWLALRAPRRPKGPRLALGPKT
jgi:ADP-ribose pyrophosphatase